MVMGTTDSDKVIPRAVANYLWYLKKTCIYEKCAKAHFSQVERIITIIRQQTKADQHQAPSDK